MGTKPARKNGWKDIQFKNKVKQKTKLAVFILAIILGIIIIGWTIRLTQTLFSPWKLSEGNFKNYVWNGDFNLNVLLGAKDLALLSYNPADRKITIIGIPNETLLEVPGGFGKWQAGSIYDLGESEERGRGSKLLRVSIADFFGLPIDGFLQFEGPDLEKNSRDLVEDLRQNYFSGLGLLLNLKTDLTLLELIRFKVGLTTIRFDKVKVLDLLSLGILDRDFLADGTPIFSYDPVKIDSISSKLSDPKIVSEHKTIAVFNSTDHPQIAQKGARIITNLGGNVIITANFEVKTKVNKVFGEESKTLRRLSQIFDSGGKKDEKAGSPSSRAQINVLLGEDFLNIH